MACCVLLRAAWRIGCCVILSSDCLIEQSGENSYQSTLALRELESHKQQALKQLLPSEMGEDAALS